MSGHRHDTGGTGRGRAFWCPTDRAGVERLPELLRSMALTNPTVCEDLLLPDLDLPPEGWAALHRLHPRIVVGGEVTAYAEVVPLEPHWLMAPGRAVVRDPEVDQRKPYQLGDTAFWSRYCALPGARHPELLWHFARPLLEHRPTVDLARAAALVLRERGRYEEAVEVLERVTPGVDQPRFHETLGSALMALSRHEEAETHLLLASASPQVAPRAFSQLARLAWLRGEDERARHYAGEGLDAEPVNRTCRALYVREAAPKWAPEGDQPAAGAGRLTHVALYAGGQENAGDKVLPQAVRHCLEHRLGERDWSSVQAHRLFDGAALERANAGAGVVVGGGGLFLPDTWPNGNSAWQWNVPDRALRALRVPLVVFAVGFNLFPGQRYHRDRFRDSLTTLVERATFVGLRNHGSVERVRELLPEELRDRVVYQPCPTTVTRRITPGWTDVTERADHVLLNCAYDRAGSRFQGDYAGFLARMARAVRTLRRHTEVRYAPHMVADERFVHDLRREHGLTLPVEPLYDRDNDQVRDVFRRARLVIGMRGHAGMIPFGCGTPILSLVSHPKLGYFLDDIDRPEWGLSVHDPRLAERLCERALAVLRDQDAAVADVRDRQELLWQVTRANLAALHGPLGT
ncbi:tetratricopeptide repeat-containing glycosyltransferase family protein [Streptomyces sp. NPDC005438]|uniref:tetratricopeptide repeat-containing glycosyltransferase family protein n=1 Tax=Streptomyces sp. NPDC005438 TaxID=3156880 RepID=UPI0033AA3B69